MAEYDYLDFSEENAQPTRAGGGLTRTNQTPETRDSGFVHTLGDIALAPVRGIEGAVQDVYKLADTLTLDALPNYDTRFLGESDTLAGQLVEGVSNFAAGFIPVAGWLGKAGKAGRFINLTTEAEKALSAAGKLGKAKALAAGRLAVAGAITDFAVFDGHEARLSNLVQQFPALENPVTEFLEAREDDPALVGRLRGALEGLGLTGLTEAMFLSLKALRAGRKARAAGGTPQEVEAAMDSAVPPEQLEAAVTGQPVQAGATGDLLDSAVRPSADTASEPGFLYHATNAERAREIQASGELKTFPPDFGTDQAAWPDGGVEPRSYWNPNAGTVHSFAPEEGASVVLRTRKTAAFKREGTGDFFARGPIAADQLEVLTADGWKPLTGAVPPSGGAAAQTLKPSAASMADALRALDVKPELVSEVEAALKRRTELAEQFDVGAGIPGENASGVSPRALTRDERLELELKKHDLNLSRYRGSDGAVHLVRTFEDMFDDAWRSGENPNLSRQTLEQQAEASMDSLSDMLQQPDRRALYLSIKKRSGIDAANLPRLNARIRAYKSLMLSFAEDIFKKLPRDGAITDTARLEFAQDLATFADITSNVKGLLAEQGRGLSANRIESQGITGLMNVLSDAASQARVIDTLGGRGSLDDLITKFRTAYGKGGVEGVAGMSKLAQATRGQKFVGILTEYWMNAILSGPRTIVVNGLSGMLLAAYRPLEAMLGAGLSRLGAAATGDAALARLHSDSFADAMKELVELAHAAPEAFKFAKAAAGSGDNFLDPLARVSDTNLSTGAQITAKNLNLPADSLSGRAVDFIGKSVRIPSRVLSGTDEFTKQLVYRSTARAQLVREGMKQGLSGEALAAHVTDQMDKLIWKGQAYSNAQLFNRGLEVAKQAGLTNREQQIEVATAWAQKNFDPKLSALSETAIRNAEDVTFTRPLPPNSLSAKLQRVVIQHPTLRFVMPFVRTPLNILSYAGQRFDVFGAAKALAAKRFPEYAAGLKDSQNRLIMDMMSNDPRRASDAVGRLAAGASIATWGFTMASQGIITGRGPSDPEQRRLLQQAGWQPYSIKTPRGYVSYARIDPFATMLGTIADLYDYGRYAPVEDQDKAETASYGLAVALANNFTNKSYLTGISNFVTMLEAPDRKAETFFQRYAGSLVPNVIGQSVDVADDNMRDVRGIVDSMTARIPGLSSTLPPQRNLFGEPIRRTRQLGSDQIGSVMNILVPVAYSEVSDSAVARELAALGHGFTPPKRTVHGLELTEFKNAQGQDAYDRWSELHGQIKIGGQTLPQALNRLIRSPQYTRLSELSTNEIDSPRISLINGMIQDYRRAAWTRVLREYPELNIADRSLTRQRGLLRQGRDTRFSTFGR